MLAKPSKVFWLTWFTDGEPRIRILVLTNLYPPDIMGGYELGCSQAVDELRRRGHDVRVLTSTPRVPLADHDGSRRLLHFEDIYDPYLQSHAPALTRRLALIRATMVCEQNVKLLHLEVADFDPEVVYLWNLVGIGGLGLAVAVDLSGLPWVWHLMDAGPRDLTVAAGTHQAELARLLGRRLQGTWIVCSLGLLYEVQAAGATLGDRVVAVPNWVTGDRPAPREQWFTGGRTLRCVFAGRLARDKGTDLAIDAMDLVRSGAYGPCQLDIFGDGPDRLRLEQMVQTRNLEDVVHFHRQVPRVDLLAALRESDVMIVPSAPREPFSFSALEAASMGCVPVVTQAIGITQWFGGDAGVIEVTRDASSIATGLRRVITGETDLESVGRPAMDTIWTHFTVESVMDHVETLLRERADDHGRRSVSWANIERLATLADRLTEVLTS